LVGVLINKRVRGASLMIDFHGGMVSIGVNAFSSPSLDHAFGSVSIGIFLIVHYFDSAPPTFFDFLFNEYFVSI
jgi:hypothetical protein